MNNTQEGEEETRSGRGIMKAKKKHEVEEALGTRRTNTKRKKQNTKKKQEGEDEEMETAQIMTRMDESLFLFKCIG